MFNIIKNKNSNIKSYNTKIISKTHVNTHIIVSWEEKSYTWLVTNT